MSPERKQSRFRRQNEDRRFPDWQKFYDQLPVESMPWFNPELDSDFAVAFVDLQIHSGKVLDIGTGPGTQAMQLARRGFDVTGTDISAQAIWLAEKRAAAESLSIAWKHDDILETHLAGPFDVVLDRGCFHVLPPDRRQKYVSTVATLLRPEGYLLLKCFSKLQPGVEGPYQFDSEGIQKLFSSRFNLLSSVETVYQGTLDPFPKALFSVLRKHS